MKAVEYAKNSKNLFRKERLNFAFMGRLALMIEESRSFADLKKRVDGIRMDSKKKDAELLLNEFNKTVCTEEGVGWSVQKECLMLVMMLGRYYAKAEQNRTLKETSANSEGASHEED